MTVARKLVLAVAFAAGGGAAFLAGSGEEKNPDIVAAPVVPFPAGGGPIAKTDIGARAISKKDKPNAIEEFDRAITRAAFTAGAGHDRKPDIDTVRFGVSANR